MQRKMRVLVFDDEEIIRQLMTSILQRRGYEVFTFEDPTQSPMHEREDCLCETDCRCADVIISDIKMPNMSGINFLQSQMDKGCKISHNNMLIISGFLDGKTLHKAAEMGITTMRKPFSFSLINEWLDECEKSVDLTVSLADLP